MSPGPQFFPAVVGIVDSWDAEEGWGVLRTPDGLTVLRTTSISPGYVVTELSDWIPDPDLRAQTQETMRQMGIPAGAVPDAIAFAIAQPHEVEIGEIVLRPTV